MALTRRQRQILDFIGSFIEENGYSPSLEEIGDHLGLSSVATVHKHVSLLVEKGLVRRRWNQNRSLELVPRGPDARAVSLPLVGHVAAGQPLEALQQTESVDVPEALVARRGSSFVLQVRGESMMDEQIRDGDLIIVEERQTAENGEVVVALVDDSEATLKKFYRQNGKIRLQPANKALRPIILDGRRVRIQGVVIGLIRRYQ